MTDELLTASQKCDSNDEMAINQLLITCIIFDCQITTV